MNNEKLPHRNTENVQFSPYVFLHLYECIMYLGYDISNELAFNKLLFDVPFMWL